MKITRKELATLIVEEARRANSILFEMPEDSTGTHSSSDINENDGDASKRALYHMSQQSQQLHDMLMGDENLEPWVQDKIVKAARDLEEVFKAITYDKGPGQGAIRE
ncbi:hypothetical protein CMI37_35965 [Candidatus Pacearchaeota archaeon]|nr:hypothetical protein [Candidatus Pacearchaeota archaeon]|tara:strand:+ start:2857 stop:3177 length:321 start_codon:yes stop_codon:yes gene_type:complete